MLTYAISIIIPLTMFFASFMLTKKMSGGNDKKPQNKLKFRLFYLLTGEIMLFMLMLILADNFMNGRSTIPLSAIFITSVIPFAAEVSPLFIHDKRAVRILRRTSAAVLLLMVTEVVLFNAKSFDQLNCSKIYYKDDINVESGLDDDSSDLIFKSNGAVTITDLPDYTKGIIINMKQEDLTGKSGRNQPIICEVAYTDDNFPKNYVTAQSKNLMAFSGSCDFTVNPYGKARTIKVSLSAVSAPVEITSIRVVSALPFRFSMIRFIVLLLIFTGVSAIIEYRVWRMTYDRRSIAHNLIYSTLTVALALSVIIFSKPGVKPEKYQSFAQPITNPFAMQAAAFDEHQVSLLYEPHPSTEQTENIYSLDQRLDDKVDYLWDYAYYNGSYYSYFGIVPTLMLFYPYQHFTGKVLPVETAVLIFSMIGVYFLCMALLAAVRLMVPRPNLLLLLLALPAAVGTAGFYYTVNYGDKYCVALSCAMMFVYLSIWQGITAYSEKNRRKRIIRLIISGTALVLAAGARPGTALSGAVLLPLFIGILRDRKIPLSNRIKQAISFGAPVFAGCIGILWFNYARFGSPFDFGAAYQLTVSDVHANTLSISELPAALFHYFFAPLRVRTAFPFFESQYGGLANYSRYEYIDLATPVFTLPMITAGIAAIPMIYKKGRKPVRGITAFQRNSIYLTCCITSLAIAWMNFCMGGIIQRYVIDLMPLMLIAAVTALLRVNVRPGKHRYLYTITAFCITSTFIISWLIELSYRLGCIHLRHPELLETVEDLLIFWH